MRYQLQKFIEEKVTLEGVPKTLYVALINDNEAPIVEMPFRVTIENFTSQDAAMEEVAKWIAARNLEDEQAKAEKLVDQDLGEKRGLLDKLNSALPA
jgi:hypothetical protein